MVAKSKKVVSSNKGSSTSKTGKSKGSAAGKTGQYSKTLTYGNDNKYYYGDKNTSINTNANQNTLNTGTLLTANTYQPETVRLLNSVGITGGHDGYLSSDMITQARQMANTTGSGNTIGNKTLNALKVPEEETPYMSYSPNIDVERISFDRDSYINNLIKQYEASANKEYEANAGSAQNKKEESLNDLLTGYNQTRGQYNTNLNDAKSNYLQSLDSINTSGFGTLQMNRENAASRGLSNSGLMQALDQAVVNNTNSNRAAQEIAYQQQVNGIKQNVATLVENYGLNKEAANKIYNNAIESLEKQRQEAYTQGVYSANTKGDEYQLNTDQFNASAQNDANKLKAQLEQSWKEALLQSKTSKYSADRGYDASKYSADTSLKSTKLQIKEAWKEAKLDNKTKIRLQQMSDETQLKVTKLSTSAQVRVAGISADAGRKAAEYAANAEYAASKYGTELSGAYGAIGLLAESGASQQAITRMYEILSNSTGKGGVGDSFWSAVKEEGAKIKK